MSQPTKRNKASNGHSIGHHNNVPHSHNVRSEKTKNHKGHNRNSIPRDLRNDLDKALVWLCDVWFDEIKPYLVRNNIKLHVKREHKEQTVASTECSHCDPASSAPSCSLCELLFNAANSIESAVCQATSNHFPPNFAAHAQNSKDTTKSSSCGYN